MFSAAETKEIAMIAKITRVVVVGGLLVSAFAFVGCQSSTQPSSLTGQDEMRERQRFTDSRGYYHPDWRAGINTPPGR